jgi:hypothetical protein
MKQGLFGKKAQLSAYIIIGLIIVGVIVGYFLLNPTLQKVNPEIQPLYEQVSNCIHDVGEEALYTIGRSGGYIEVPQPALEESVAYYLYDNTNYMPSKKTIEEQLSLYMDFMVPFCIDPDEFDEYTITEKNVETKTSIEDEQVIFTVDYPLSIQKGESRYSIRSFESEIPVRLGAIHDAVAALMDEQMKRTDAVCATCLYSISEDYQLHFQILDTAEKNNLVFVVRDEQSKILNEDYQFYFAIKLEEMG